MSMGSITTVTSSIHDIGLATARWLAGLGHHVVLSGPKFEEGKRAADAIMGEGGSAFIWLVWSTPEVVGGLRPTLKPKRPRYCWQLEHIRLFLYAWNALRSR